MKEKKSNDVLVFEKGEKEPPLLQYIKSNRLQDAEDRRIVVCDDRLKQIFGMPKIMFPNLPELLSRHLFPADPVVLSLEDRKSKVTGQRARCIIMRKLRIKAYRYKI